MSWGARYPMSRRACWRGRCTLEADGLISRKVYPVVPPRVEYSLTEMGQSLVPLINDLTAWAQQNMARIMSHRRAVESDAAM